MYMKTYYKAKNGLEYLTEKDAEVYGKGYVSHYVVDDNGYKIAPGEYKEEVKEEDGYYDDLSDDELKQMAKDLGIKVGRDSRKKLIDKINEVIGKEA